MKGASTATFAVKLTALAITALLGLFFVMYLVTPAQNDVVHPRIAAGTQTIKQPDAADLKAAPAVQIAAPTPTADDDDEADAEAASCDGSGQAALSCTAKEWHDDAIAVANAAYQAAIVANQPIDQAKAARDKAIALAEACLTQNELTIDGTPEHPVTGVKARLSCTPPKALKDAMAPYEAARDAEATARAARQEARQQQAQAAAPAPAAEKQEGAHEAKLTATPAGKRAIGDWVVDEAAKQYAINDPSHSHGLRHQMALAEGSSDPMVGWVRISDRGSDNYGSFSTYVSLPNGWRIPFNGSGAVKIWRAYSAPFSLQGVSEPVQNVYLDYSMVCPLPPVVPKVIMGATALAFDTKDGRQLHAERLSNETVEGAARVPFTDLFNAVCWRSGDPLQ